MTFYYCPDCEKKGLSLRLAQNDYYACRYCAFCFYTDGDYESDRKNESRTAVVNPSGPFTDKETQK